MKKCKKCVDKGLHTMSDNEIAEILSNFAVSALRIMDGDKIEDCCEWVLKIDKRIALVVVNLLLLIEDEEI